MTPELLEDDASASCLHGFNQSYYLRSRLFEQNRFSLETIFKAFEKAKLIEKTVDMKAIGITTKNKLRQSFNRIEELSCEQIFEVIKKSTSVQLDNCVHALSVNWSNSRSTQISQELPPLIIRQDGSLSMLLEVSGVQHLENVLSVIQSKKFVRQNLMLYLSLRDYSSNVDLERLEDIKRREQQAKDDATIEKIKFIEKNSCRLGECFESGISDFFQLSRDKAVNSN
jgi:hypothetical protein